MKTKFTYKNNSTDGHYYFLFLIISIIIIAAISLISSANLRSSVPLTLIDSLNSPGTLYFDFGSFVLKPESIVLLDRLSDELKNSPEAKIEISGHTDDIGSDGFNYELSEKRAEAVREYLISRGNNAGQLIIIPKGKEEPVNNNFSESERSLNRRVEFKWNAPILKETERDVELVNSVITKINRTEIETEISARDTSGDPVKGIEEKNISAVLKWKEDSASGEVHFLPIDDKKKPAYTLVLDYSPSMFSTEKYTKLTPKSKKIEQMESAVKGFINAIGNNAFVKIIKFGRYVDVVQRFTKSKEIMLNAVEDKSYPRGGTALFAAVYWALKDTTYNSNPTIMKTVIAFTDGMDNSSEKITKDSVYKISEDRAVRVFTIGLLDIADDLATLTERIKGEIDLKDIAGQTGGFFYRAKDASELAPIYKQIFSQLTNSYKVSIKWNEERLPPKGSYVSAIVRVNINGKIRTFIKDYVME